MEILLQACVWVVIGFGLIQPFFLTRMLMRTTAEGYVHYPPAERDRAIGRSAGYCVALTLLLGLCFTGWCVSRIQSYVPGPYLDFGPVLELIGCFLPLIPLGQVLFAAQLPVDVQA